MANYLLDIVILLTAGLVAVPLFRAAGIGAAPEFLVASLDLAREALIHDDGDAAVAEDLILQFRDEH